MGEHAARLYVMVGLSAKKLGPDCFPGPGAGLAVLHAIEYVEPADAFTGSNLFVQEAGAEGKGATGGPSAVAQSFPVPPHNTAFCVHSTESSPWIGGNSNRVVNRG